MVSNDAGPKQGWFSLDPAFQPYRLDEGFPLEVM